MIPDFQELSDKIDQLAELTHALRRENAQLRQANAALVVENMGYQRKLGEASSRVAALLEQIPAPDEENAVVTLPETQSETQPASEDAR